MIARRRPGRPTACTALLVLAACGYAPVQVHAPEGVRRVSVGAFVVTGGPPVVGGWVAQGVARELAVLRSVALSGGAGADASVRGSVALADEPALAQSSSGPGGGPRSALASAVLEVRARLIRRDGAVLRDAGPLRVSAARLVAASGGADLARQRRALREVAADAARQIVQALFAAP